MVLLDSQYQNSRFSLAPCYKEACILADRSLAWLSFERLLPAADSDRCRDPQPSIRLSFMEELGEGLRALKEIETLQKDQESTNLDSWGSQSLNHQPKNIHRLDLAPPRLPHI
jgi:hypothetical protein